MTTATAPDVPAADTASLAVPGSRAAAPARLWLDVTVLTVVVVGSLALFAGKPLHIDDPFYVLVGEHILEQPLDFFGLTINWYGHEQQLADVNQNPPLVCYWIALVLLVAGGSEVALHLAFVLPALSVVLGVYALGTRWSGRPFVASLAALATPVLLVSATTVMSDVLMLASYCWSVFFWTRGIDERRPRDLCIGALLIAVSTLTKYFGVTLFPLLFAYGVLGTRRLGVWVAWFALPVAVLAGYEILSTALYGHGLFLTAAGYAVSHGQGEGHGVVGRSLLGLVFAGGCVAPVLLWSPFTTSRRGLLVGLGVVVTAVVALWASGRLGVEVLRDEAGTRWPWFAHAAVFAAAAIALLWFVADGVRTQRDRYAVFLALWIGGTLAFAVVVNWTTNARAVLPLVPALGILVARNMDHARAPLLRARTSLVVVPAAVGLILSVVVAHGDQALAASSRRAADLVTNEFGGRFDRVLFTGHWGFQHYMERGGARPVDFSRTELRPGDLLVVPGNNSNVLPVPPGVTSLVERIEVPLHAVAATMSQRDGAGFYTSMWGPFPYAIGTPPNERYWLLQVTAPFRFLPATD